VWYEITLPDFSYSFETDRYRDEAEARGHIFKTIARQDIEYMRRLTIRPMYEKLVTSTQEGT
jgi:hypothetical protein